MTAERCGWTIALLVALAWLPPTPAPGEWQAGVAKVNITPGQSMWMAGYAARDHAAQGKLTDLWAKALVLEDGAGQRAVLVSLDLIGLDRALAGSICRQLEQEFGFARPQIALCASHTHSGPVVGRNLEPLHYRVLDELQRQRIDEYARALPARISEAVAAALHRLESSRLSWGSGTARFAVNRRNNPAAEVPARRTAGTLQGPVDHDVPVLAVHDAAGQLKAVVFGYACHATVLSDDQWCGDYPGFAQQELETEHPACVALFWAGCGADQNPLPRRTVELARHYGRQLATAVDSVLLTSALEPVADRLVTHYQEIELALDRLPSTETLAAAACSEDKYQAARARLLLERLAANPPLPQSYPYPVGVWQLGDDLQWVTLGGEVVVDYALRIKAELSGRKTWVAGYCHDVMAYIPSLRVLREGGYEGATAMVYYGLPACWAADVEETIVQAVHATQPAEVR